jgi:hypothetical protein
MNARTPRDERRVCVMAFASINYILQRHNGARRRVGAQCIQSDTLTEASPDRPLVATIDYETPRVAPDANTALISASSIPTSRKISTLCSPSRGGSRRIAPGVLL